ncbi:hypothetical protein Tco_0809346 [Tanacetum coccineum]
MDRLSKRKFGIVCHEKVVRIPLEGDEILRVHGETYQGVVKPLMNTKFAMLSKYQLENLLWKCKNVETTLKSCKTKVSYDLVIFREEHQCCLLRRGAWSSFEVRVGITEEGRCCLLYAAESVRDTIGFEYCLASSSGWTKVKRMDQTLGSIMRACVIDFGCKKLKATRGPVQRSCADNRRKPLEFKVGERVMLKVSPWKGVIRFGKKGKLTPRYVGPFEILERVGPVAYRLRLPDELSGIKVDKTLRFVKEPVENSDREVKRLKCSRMVVVKVHLGSKRGL